MLTVFVISFIVSLSIVGASVILATVVSRAVRDSGRRVADTIAVAVEGFWASTADKDSESFIALQEAWAQQLEQMGPAELNMMSERVLESELEPGLAEF